MDTLSTDDMLSIIGFMPKDVRELLERRNASLVLAGGYVRARISREDPSDIDLFSPSKEDAKSGAEALAAGRQGATVYRTRNAFSVLCQGRIPVQFIHRWTYPTARELLLSFDFTIAQAAIWRDGDHWRSACTSHFYPDLAAKRLHYLSPNRHEDAGGSLLRMQKFLSKGYSISPESMAAVVARLIRGVNAETRFWQAGEQAQGKVLAGLLRKVDPLTIVDGLPTADSLEDEADPPPIAPAPPPFPVPGVDLDDEMPL